MNPLKIIGGNIKKIREEKFIKQQTLAKQLGLTKGRISQIENGECAELSLQCLIKIAIYLETDFLILLPPYNSAC
jgi:transcriptional regulator with XRE-family HTH domain